MVLSLLLLSLNPHVLSYLLDQVKFQGQTLKSLVCIYPQLPVPLLLCRTLLENNNPIESNFSLLCASIYAAEYSCMKSHSHDYWNYFKFIPSNLNWKFNVIHALSHSPAFILHTISSLFKPLKLPIPPTPLSADELAYCITEKFAVIRSSTCLHHHIYSPNSICCHILYILTCYYRSTIHYHCSPLC